MAPHNDDVRIIQKFYTACEIAKECGLEVHPASNDMNSTLGIYKNNVEVEAFESVGEVITFLHGYRAAAKWH